MLNGLIEFSLKQRLIVIIFSFALFVYGLYSFFKIPVDAFPDISSTQVKIILKAPGMTPEEVESRVVRPLEAELLGLEGQKLLKSVSKYAIADITIDFEEGYDIYKARAQTAEKLSLVMSSLPKSVSGGMAPVTTPLSEVFMFTIEGNISSAQKRELLDFTIRPALRGVKGVADINALGGEVKAIVVEPDFAVMSSLGVSVLKLEEAINKNLSNDGAGRVNKGDEGYLVRIESGAKGVKDIADITVLADSKAIRIGDFCDVKYDSLNKMGFVTKNGAGEAVEGLVLTLKGANSKETIRESKRALENLKPTLPKGVYIEPFYDRSFLTQKAVDTVSKALLEAVVLVVILLFLFLGDARAAVAVSIILPFSIAFAFLLMRYFGLSANLMSLGGLAIAVGMLVDSAVVMVENSFSALSQKNSAGSKIQKVLFASKEVSVAVFSGILIIIAVFLPLLSLEGLEGKLFSPVAITIVFALLGSLLLSLTLIPAVCSMILKEREHKESRLMSFFLAVYAPLLRFAMTHTKKLFAAAAIFAALSFSLFFTIGKEFMPTLDEGDVILSVELPPSVSIQSSLAANLAIQKELKNKVYEIDSIVARTGSDELGLDPMGINQTDTFIKLKPQSEWRAKDKEEIKESIRSALAGFKGVSFGFTQPIEMRSSEMLSGSRGDLAVKVYGHDIKKLNEISANIASILEKIEGSKDVFTTLNEGLNYLSVAPNRADLVKSGVDANELKAVLKSALEGIIVDYIPIDSARVATLIRMDKNISNDPSSLGSLQVVSEGKGAISLSAIADIKEVDGPVKIDREGGMRISVTTANVEGRDLVGFAAEARRAIEANVKLPYGYKIAYGGEFENEQRASATLMKAVPVSIAVIFAILFFTFRSISLSLLTLLNIPFAITGGIIALFLSGEYMSVPASVGFIALFGIATLNGVVMISYFLALLKEGYSLDEAVREGAKRRLRPVLMTAFIAALGLIPLLLATGVGSEIQRPLAIVALGGLVTSTALTLLILPPAFKAVRAWSLRRKDME